jgi:23S rRNA (uracil1939-C5)-methyltransferase
MTNSNAGESITVSITGLAVGGACIGQVTAGREGVVGKKAFVRDALPGEVVECEIVKEHDRFVDARLVSITTPSSARRAAPCQYAAACGGCDLQHSEVTEQRRMKKMMIEQMLARQAGITVPGGVVELGPTLPELHYRNRITLHVSESGQIGYYKRGTSSVVDVQQCLLANAAINTELSKLRTGLRKASRVISGVIFDTPPGTSEVHVVAQIPESVRITDSFRQSPEVQELLHLNPAIEFEQRGNSLFEPGDDDGFPAGHFSQVNHAGNQLLIEEVLRSVRSSALTELYAGSGNFSLPLARTGKRVDAVELDPELVDYGVKLASQQGLTKNVQFFTMSCEQFVKVRPLRESLLLDPPRAGAKEVVGKFDPKILKEVVYVSCSLPMLARDLKVLVQRGYRVERVAFVDMFPQTHHVETVTTLRT